MQVVDKETSIPLLSQAFHFDKSVIAAKKAIAYYLHYEADSWFRDKGRSRARKLLKYLDSIPTNSEENHRALFALFLAIFDKHTFFIFGRSSELASQIANQWITGHIVFSGISGSAGDLDSEIFPLNLVTKADKAGCYDYHSEGGTFSHIKGVRFILQEIFALQSEQARKTIITLYDSFKRVLNNATTERIELFFLPDKERYYVIAALIGAFSPKLPNSVLTHSIAPFLSFQDVKASLCKVNKASFFNVCQLKAKPEHKQQVSPKKIASPSPTAL